jgi:replicative DNA helicase
MVGILAAADGMGKTTFLEQVAEYWAECGYQTVYVHLEDALDYKLDRRTARQALVEMNHIEDGTLTAEEWRKVEAADHRMAQWACNLHYYHAAGKCMGEIVRELESRISEGVCQAVVFDYLDKVQPSRGQAKLFGDNTWERQAADMESLKTFAEKANIPVFTATQGNKSMQNGGTQTRQNIQGSGQKSQKAQLVIILSRDIVGDGGLYDSDNVLLAEAGEYSPIVNVRVDKQNRGRTGGFKQYLAGKYFTVRDIERRPLES